MIEPKKRCCRCKEAKSLLQFYNANKGRFKKRADCKECHKTSMREWREKNRERIRESNRIYTRDNPDIWRKRDLRRAYGISLEQYQEMVERQGGLCAICGGLPGKLALAVDHNHETGQVRDLLCPRCNVGMGMLLDDPDLLRAAAAYLERWKEV
jgi:hypothetical protein